jgi:hypothetical protein
MPWTTTDLDRYTNIPSDPDLYGNPHELTIGDRHRDADPDSKSNRCVCRQNGP